jgi:hypothetical protein
MEGTVFVGLIVLVAVLPVSLVVLSWFTKPHAMRELAPGEIKTRPIRYTSAQLAARRRGCFAEFGEDFHTHQPFILPEELRRANFLTLGPSNSGKTFYMLHALMWRDIRYRDNAVVVFDSQRDLTESVIALCREVGREFVVFPDATYNPLGGEGSARDRAEAFADLIAQSAETAIDAESRYYLSQEQDFIRVMIPLFEAAYRQPMILQELVILCKRGDVRARLRRAAGPCPEGGAYDLYVDTVSAARIEKILSGLVSTIQKLTVGSRISLHNARYTQTIAECLRQRKVVIIREGGVKTSRFRPLGLMYMIALQNAILARNPFPADPGPFVAIYMDECYKYFNRDFDEFINSNRKFNCALHLGFQTMAQLRPHASEILDGCATWAIHPRLLAEDAQIVADNIGQRLFSLKSISHSASQGKGGLSQTETTGFDYLIPPHYIRNLPERFLLLLSVEGRETAAVRTIVKPAAHPLETSAYSAQQVGPYPPQTIWDEQDIAAATAAAPPSGTAAAPGNVRTPPNGQRQPGNATPPGSPGGSKAKSARSNSAPPPPVGPEAGAHRQQAHQQQVHRQGQSPIAPKVPGGGGGRGGSHTRGGDTLPPPRRPPRARAPHFDANTPAQSAPAEQASGDQEGRGSP